MRVGFKYPVDVPTVRIDAPLNSIRYIVLTDGTIYENNKYTRGRILTRDEYSAIFETLSDHYLEQPRSDK